MYNYSPHFRDQETEAQRGSISCPTSQSYKMVKVASESSLSDSRSCILHHPALLLKSLFSLLSVVSALLLVTVFTGPCDVYKDYSLYSREIKDFLKQNQDSFSVTWNHYLSQISVKKRNQRAVAWNAVSLPSSLGQRHSCHDHSGDASGSGSQRPQVWTQVRNIRLEDVWGLKAEAGRAEETAPKHVPTVLPVEPSHHESPCGGAMGGYKALMTAPSVCVSPSPVFGITGYISHHKEQGGPHASTKG